jgi:hypothetical protein
MENKMAKAKPTKDKVPDWHTGLAGDSDLVADPKKEGIPVVLQVQNRKPLTPEQQAQVDAAMAKTPKHADRVDMRKPKGMGWEEWDALQSRNATAERTATGERLAKANFKPRVPSIRKSNGMLDAHHFAKEIGCEAKLVRRALRDKKQTTIKKPAYGWCFTEAEAPQVIAVVKAWLADKGKPKAKASKAKAESKAKQPKTKPQPEAEPAKEQDKVTKKAVDKMLAKLPAKKKK